MENYLFIHQHDLITPDGKITAIKKILPSLYEAHILIENISPGFLGFTLDPQQNIFNLKSTLAQLGVNAIGKECILNPQKRTAEVKVEIEGFGPIAQAMIELLEVGAYIGKLFASDDRRKVRDPDYLLRMFGRTDRKGSPLLSFGDTGGKEGFFLEKIDGRAVAHIKLLPGVVTYNPTILGFLPTLAKALCKQKIPTRELLAFNQKWKADALKCPLSKEILLVRTEPLHIRTVFGRVAETLLPKGYSHTSASILEPHTEASGDIYEFFGNADTEIDTVPLEFYTLEPYKEYVFFNDREQLQASLENPEMLFKVFDTAPLPKHNGVAVFIVKGEQLLNLKPENWVTRVPHFYAFPGLAQPENQALLAEHYIYEQPSYPFLKNIEDGWITSQGVLFCRYLPSPLMKKMLLESHVQRNLKGIYFQCPSQTYGNFFSHEDRSFLIDLAKFGIPVYWVDSSSQKILKYTPKPGKDAGMFVPLSLVDTFIKATTFGLYGSNLVTGDFEGELKLLFEGLLKMKEEVNHPLLNKETPISLVTGGGPGVMEVGNRVAKQVNILSCADIADFTGKTDSIVNEQKQNPYIEAKMTYRLDRLVERQAELNLDFPIFLIGGIGTDIE